MAITTDFIGHIGVEPALDSDQIEGLARPSRSRPRRRSAAARMRLGAVRGRMLPQP